VKRPAAAKKTLTAANLTALGAERLAELLLEAATGDAALKRYLRMALAAEVSPADLAFELDKRLTALSTSQARVSWRKRPELIQELATLRRVIVERLGAQDPRLALDRLVAWFDLYPGLTARVKDPKGEMTFVFEAAGEDIAGLANALDPAVAAPILTEPLSTRLGQWAAWIGKAAPTLSEALARRLVHDLTAGKPTPTGRLALVIRRLADRAGDIDAWIATLPVEDRRRRDLGAEIAQRLALAGRPVEARAALDAISSAPDQPSRWGRKVALAEPQEAQLAAEIAVLDAEGKADDADIVRWRLFERTLDEAPLRAILARLADFEDVIALERAFAIASAHPDATKGLAFLMAWPALPEAAAMIRARDGEVRGLYQDVALWIARMQTRFPLVALLLLRRRIVALLQVQGEPGDEMAGMLSEAKALAEQIDAPDVPSHADFSRQLLDSARRGRWR
jgi:hypothetical protein